MEIKQLIFLLGVLLMFSCVNTDDFQEPDNLQAYINESQKNINIDNVIACAASDEIETNISYIFYYPIDTATNIQYFETTDASVDKNDFALYKPINLEKEAVFNGYLERFIRDEVVETWCIVTYEFEGEIHISNPIRLKNNTKPTEWSDAITINNETSLMPQFVWEDGSVKENAIYFQVISEANNDFLSGTYTFEKWFQFYKLDNVVLNITEDETPTLIKNNEYNYTMMGVSEDNWVNLVLQKPFVAE